MDSYSHSLFSTTCGCFYCFYVGKEVLKWVLKSCCLYQTVHFGAVMLNCLKGCKKIAASYSNPSSCFTYIEKSQTLFLSWNSSWDLWYKILGRIENCSQNLARGLIEPFVVICLFSHRTRGTEKPKYVPVLVGSVIVEHHIGREWC